METVIYVVQQGDTLTEIAKKYHTTVNMIARYNGIKNPDYIISGTKIVIRHGYISIIQENTILSITETLVVKDIMVV